MPIPILLLAAAASPAALYASEPYRAYRKCLSDAVVAHAKAGATPEDVLADLYPACPDQRAGLAAELRRRNYPKPAQAVAAAAPDAAAAPAETANDALVRPWRDALLVKAIRRYQVYYTTGRWTKE